MWTEACSESGPPGRKKTMRSKTHRSRIRIMAWCFLAASLGCGAQQVGGSGGSGGSGVLDGLSSIEVAPADATIFVTDGVAGAQDFTATGHFMDGSTRDVTNLVAWSVEMPIAYFPQAAHAIASGTSG